MPCTKCSTEFTLLTWKIKCTDCELYYCSKCLRRMHGSLYCEKCLILNKRPPDREKLMELRAKDLQDYLNKHHISTHGLVEKSELVELFYKRAIPVGSKKSTNRISSVLGGSVPNIAAQGQDHINQLKSNLNNMRSYAENTLHTLGRKIGSQEGNPNHSYQEQTFESYVNADVPIGQPSNVTVNTSLRTETYCENPQPTSSNSQQETFKEPSKSTPPPRYPKLSDFNSIEDLNDLSVKQLKELLSLNRVNFKGCVEKTELLDRAKCLWNDNNSKKGFDDSNLENICKICMDAPLDCVLLECGHVATCIECGKQLAECPICRQFVIRVVRTFKA